MIEKACDSNSHWYTGSFNVANMIPRGAMACTSHVYDQKVYIHVLYVMGTTVREMYWDNKWRAGSMKVDCIPGSEAAIVRWGSGSDYDMRFYFQKGEQVTGISEWMFSKGDWKAGKLALPPA